MRQRPTLIYPQPEKSQQNGPGSYRFKKRPKRSYSASFSPVMFVALVIVGILVLLLVSPGGIRGIRGRDKQPKIILTASVEKFTPTPEKFKRTFWVESGKINQPIIRAFRDRQWTKVNSYEDAQLVWRYSTKGESYYYKGLKPWQRVNHITGTNYWNAKDTFVEGFKNYEMQVPGKDHYFNPETYMLAEDDERDKFSKVLTRGGGMNRPWVLKEGNINQGKGITMLAPNSDELRDVLENNPPMDSELIIQRYVCNELTWNRRKYDVRMFWMVASIDPLLVLYHDGYTRIGNSAYDESDFSDTRKHLTTHTKLAEEGKATFDEFEQHVRQHNRDAELGISDPVSHVRSQFKEAIGETVAAFKSRSFTTKKMAEENGIAFYGADFILDQDLDVYLLEPQMGCGLDEDYNFRIEMHDQMFRSMVDVLDEVLVKQEKGENLLPLNKPGKWEVVYADGWVYKFDGYQRSKQKKDCDLPPELKTTKKKKKKDDDSEVEEKKNKDDEEEEEEEEEEEDQ